MTACPAAHITERVQFLTRALSILFLLGWLAWFWPFDNLLDRQGTPLGADFSMFYVAGGIAADGQFARLYDQAEHQRRLHEQFPGLSPQFCLPFRYPPLVAILLAPLARLPYLAAWILFALASAGTLALSAYFLSRSRPEAKFDAWRPAAIWVLVGWPVVLEVLIGGQASLFSLGIAVGTWALLQRERPVAAGACLALAALKPNVLAIFALGIAVRFPRVIGGAVPMLAALTALSMLAGRESFAEFLTVSTQLAAGPWDVETPFWKVHSLAPWLDFVLPGRGRVAAVVLGLAAAGALGLWWRHRDGVAQESGERGPLVPGILLAVNALFNPYTPIYDLALLGAAAWWIADSLSRPVRGTGAAISLLAAQGLLALLFFGPHLSQALARPLGVQLFPLALVAGLLYVVTRVGEPAGRSYGLAR